MANGIERIYLTPNLFESMSAIAAKRVQKQSSSSLVIKFEIELFQSKNKK